MVSLETIYDLTTPMEVAVSPDGTRVAVVARERSEPEEAARSVLYVVPTDGSRSPHRLTRASEAGSPVWSPDGTKLGVIAARETDLERTAGSTDADGSDSDGDDADVDDADDSEDSDASAAGGAGDGDDEPKPQVWVYDLEYGGDPRQVTDCEEGVRSFDWSPDGDQLVVASRDPTERDREYLDRRREDDAPIETERLQHVSEGHGYLDAVRTYLFVVDADGGDSRRLDDAYGRGAREPIAGLQPAWGDGGIAFTTYDGPEPDDTMALDVHLADPEDGTTERLTDGDVTATAPAWSPAGDRIATVTSDPENFYAPRECQVLDPETGTVDCITESVPTTLSMYGGAAWLDEETVLASLADRGTTRLLALDADGNGPTPLPPGRDAGRSIMGYDAAGGTVAAIVTDPTDGIDVVVADGDSLRADADDESADVGTPVTAFDDEPLESYPALEMTRRSVEVDGTTVEALLSTPGDDVDAEPPYPTVVKLHGGPMAYDQPTFDFSVGAFTSRGYAVLQPNFRGSTSYGREFAEALRGQWGTHDVDDVQATVDDVVDAGVADPDRLFVTGFSYGGILTALLVTRTDRFAAGAAEHGLYDLRSTFGTDDSHVWFENEFGLPWDAPARYDEASSLPDVDDIETPLLVTAGERDFRCPPDQADRLYVSLNKRDVPTRLVRYGEGHEVTAPDRAIHRLEELLRWFERFDPEVEDAEFDPRYCEGGID